MSGDHSRFTFAPRKRYSGVRMQQGRVQLDSDWNEEGDILRERLRLLALDSFGPVGVPYPTTPDAFLIGLIGGAPPDLSIEPGRLYVDGLVAELFDGEPATYGTQPFLPDPPALPAGAAVAYLDVWEREVTYIEDPDLLDVALGGVDTATRVQTIWQLRVDPVSQAECGMAVGAAPSAGRLTTRAVAPPAPTDPCILPQVAGYRGLENRLYRVEIHEGGPLGVARFKWSRDNASLVAAVSAVAGSPTSLTVNRIGRDETMRFRVGDWVTVTDDFRELNGEPGEMAQIDNIDEADRRIELDRSLPAAGGRPFGANATELAERHTRVQRWDQRPAPPGDGLIATAAGPIDLEAGIEVDFSVDPAGGEFRAGDYWLFWARTATAQIDELDAAPPRGIRHHYVQLAAIGGLPGPAATIEDCRPPAPADGCCTFVVRPGESIQAAINDLPQAGGCVCLKAGLHVIERPIRIARTNVVLHGESLGAVVLNRGGTSLLDVVAARAVRVHTLVLSQQGRPVDPVIRAVRTSDLTISDCRVGTSWEGDGIGLRADVSSDLVVSRCSFLGPALGLWFDAACWMVEARDCEFHLSATAEAVPAHAAILVRNVGGPLKAEGNLIAGSTSGIIVNDNAEGAPRSLAESTRICGNRIRLIGERSKVGEAFGIDVAALASHVDDNHIEHAGGATGIRVAGAGSSVRGNLIRAVESGNGDAVAILAGYMGEDDFVPLERVEIVDNVIEGKQSGILLAGVARSRVAGNMVGDASNPVEIGIGLIRSTDCMLADNAVWRPTTAVLALGGARNTIAGTRVDGGGNGILVAVEEAPTVSGSRLTGLESLAIAILWATQRCNVVENRIVRCGWGAPLASGISAGVILGELHVEGNEVMDIGVAPASPARAPLAYGIAGQFVLEARIESNLVTYSGADLLPRNREDRALRMRGWRGFSVQIGNNKFLGPGRSALVELWEELNPDNDADLWRFDRVLFHGNYCAHFTGGRGGFATGRTGEGAPKEDIDQRGGATVSLVGGHCSITGNHVVAATRAYPSWDLHGMPGPFIANVSHHDHSRRATEMPAPENDFNTIA
ncbi:MAG TPA: DUF6519 domain-containing protein [Allosphingosinicella sp.]|nr:DUF6519 domain-containing protein [Allosphingosinicella sp.]